MVKGQLSKMPRAEQWAHRICAQHTKSVESIIEVGRLLSKARAELIHGEWVRMFADELVPFCKRSADMMIAVADHSVLSNGNHGSHLPPSWRTLYELTKVPAPVLKNAIKDGVITPDMQRKAVKALLPSKPSDRPRPVVEPEPFDADAALLRIVHVIRTEVAAWPDGRPLDLLIRHLRNEADRLEQRMEKQAS